MPLVGDYFAADIEVTQAAAVEGRYGPQWKVSLKVPWSQFTADNNWISQDGYTGPPLGEPPALFYVAALKEGKDDDGHAWSYNYNIKTLDYDGDESALEDAPQMGGGAAPPMPTEKRPAGQRETQQPQQPQSYGEPALRNGRAREVSIAWGQSINLAATSSIPSEEEPFDDWMIVVRRKARTLFPLLIKWEKEAVDNYFAQQDEPVLLTDDQSREASLQNEERVRDPLPTQTQPTLATDVDSLGWPIESPPEGTPAYVVPKNWDYNEFKQRVIANNLGLRVPQIFPMTDTMNIEQGVGGWCLSNGKTWEEAFEYLTAKTTESGTV